MTNELRTKYPLDTFSMVEQDEIIRLIESEISLALEKKVKEVEKLNNKSMEFYKEYLGTRLSDDHAFAIAVRNEVIKILKQ